MHKDEDLGELLNNGPHKDKDIATDHFGGQHIKECVAQDIPNVKKGFSGLNNGAYRD